MVRTEKSTRVVSTAGCNKSISGIRLKWDPAGDVVCVCTCVCVCVCFWGGGGDATEIPSVNWVFLNFETGCTVYWTGASWGCSSVHFNIPSSEIQLFSEFEFIVIAQICSRCQTTLVDVSLLGLTREAFWCARSTMHSSTLRQSKQKIGI